MLLGEIQKLCVKVDFTISSIVVHYNSNSKKIPSDQNLFSLLHTFVFILDMFEIQKLHKKNYFVVNQIPLHNYLKCRQEGQHPTVYVYMCSIPTLTFLLFNSYPNFYAVITSP